MKRLRLLLVTCALLCLALTASAAPVLGPGLGSHVKGLLGPGPLPLGWTLESVDILPDAVVCRLQHPVEGGGQLELLHPSAGGPATSSHFAVRFEHDAAPSEAGAASSATVAQAFADHIRPRDRRSVWADPEADRARAEPRVTPSTPDVEVAVLADHADSRSSPRGLLWLIAAGLGVLLLLRPGLVSQVVGALLYCTGVGLAAVFAYAEPGFVTVWIVPLVGAPLVLRAIWRSEQRHLVAVVLGTFLLALVARLLAPPDLANQNTDLFGPADSVATFARWGSGATALYRVLDMAVPVSGGALLVLQCILSAATVALLTGAAYRTSRSLAFALVVGGLLALEPAQLRLGASDAAHVPGLFAGAMVAAACVWREQLGRAAPMLLVGCAAVPPLVRPELAPAVPMLVFLFAGWSGWRTTRTWLGGGASHLYVAAGLGAGMAGSWIALGDPIDVPDLTVGTAWWFEFLGRHFGATYGAAAPPDYPLDWHQPLFWQPLLFLAVGGAIVSLLRRDPRSLLVVAGLAVYFVLVRASSGLMDTPLAQDICEARYDLAIMAMAMFPVARLFTDLGTLGSRLSKNHLGHPAPGAAAAPAAAVGLAVALAPAPWTHPLEVSLPFQREYAFLDRHLASVETGCVVVVAGMPVQEPLVSDDVLHLPHGVLSYSYPDVRWEAVELPQQRPDLCGVDCAWYYTGSLCALTDAWLQDFPPDGSLERERDRRTYEAQRRMCSALRSAAGGPLAEEHLPTRTLPYDGPPGRLPEGRLKLGLYPLDVGAFQQACP